MSLVYAPLAWVAALDSPVPEAWDFVEVVSSKVVEDPAAGIWPSAAHLADPLVWACFP